MLSDFENSITGSFNSKFAVKSSLSIPPYLRHVKRQYRKTSDNVKHMERFYSYNKSQGSLATYLKCSGLFNDHFTTNLLLRLLAKQFLKSVNIWRSYRKEGWLSHALYMGNPLHGEKFAIDFTYDMQYIAQYNIIYYNII